MRVSTRAPMVATMADPWGYKLREVVWWGNHLFFGVCPVASSSLLLCACSFPSQLRRWIAVSIHRMSYRRLVVLHGVSELCYANGGEYSNDA